MAHEDSVNVGAFASQRADGRPVPANIVGKHIWFSHSKEYFVVTDEDNNIIQSLGYFQFKKYVDAGVITYTNPGIKQHMMEVLDEAIEAGKVTPDQEVPGADGRPKKKQSNKKETLLKQEAQSARADDLDGISMDGDYEDYDYGYEEEMVGGYALQNQQMRAQQEARRKPPKDPTKRIGWFFAVFFILAVMIAVVMVFFPSLLQQASNILPH